MIGWLLASVLAVGEPSIADASRVELEWTAPESCPQQREVASRTEQLLLSSDAAVRARASIAASPDGSLVLEVTVVAHDGEASYRHVGTECDELADVAALFVAVAADPSSAIEAAAIGHSPPPARAPMPARVVSTPAPRESPPPHLGGWVRVHGVVGYAQLPQLDAGFGFAAALAIDRVRIELSYAHLFGRERDIPGLAPASGVLVADDFALRGCVELGRKRVRLGGCIGPELGAVTGRARHVREPGHHTSLWVAATAGPVLRWIMAERVQLHAGVDGVLGLHRPNFAVQDDPSATIGTQRGGVRAMLGIAIGFGNQRVVDQNRPRRRS